MVQGPPCDSCYTDKGLRPAVCVCSLGPGGRHPEQQKLCTHSPLESSLQKRARRGVGEAKLGVSVGDPPRNQGLLQGKGALGSSPKTALSSLCPELPKPEIHSPGKFLLSCEPM